MIAITTPVCEWCARQTNRIIAAREYVRAWRAFQKAVKTYLSMPVRYHFRRGLIEDIDREHRAMVRARRSFKTGRPLW